MDVDFLLDHDVAEPGHDLEVRGLLRVEGRAPTDQADRAPLNLAVVLDRSGSMAGSKLHSAREAASLLVRRLRPNDRVSAVCYDQDVHTLAEGATGKAQARLAEQLAQITTGGTTNLSGGWLQGRQLVSSHRSDETVNRIILMTDGLANVGITEPKRLVGLTRAAAEEGIVTTTVGFGQDFDEDLLREMADAGGGASYYIENPDQAPGIFEEEITGLLGLAAHNVSVVIRPSANVTLVAVRHGYPRQATDDGGLRLQIGDLYDQEPRLVLSEFRVPITSDLPAEVPVARVTVQGDVIEDGGAVEHRVIELPVAFDPARGPHTEPEVQKTSLLLDAAKAREEALEMRERGDWDGAVLGMQAASARLSAVGADDENVVRELEDLDHMALRFSERAVDARDVKYMKQQALESRRARYGRKKLIQREE